MPRSPALFARCVLTVSLFVAAVSPASGQRPKLQESADTNDAKAYFDAGVALFERDPAAAAAAFHWASRIDPAWGDPLYARRAAIVRSDARLSRLATQGTRAALESREMRGVDSLLFRALTFNPFLIRQLDTGTARGKGTLLHLDRAREFGTRGKVDSAVAQMRLALTEMNARDERTPAAFYDSKALAEYSIGVLLEGSGDVAGARDAFSRALQEDLGYYPAHMHFALLAMGLKDTSTALGELALAAQLAPDEPHIRYVHGFVLATMRKNDESIAELKRATQLEPLYALPYLRLGQVYEQMGKGPEALAAYQRFVERASGGDAQRPYAMERLTELKEYLAAIPKP